jgi:lipoprotein-anchoring transpeptidase ErfK/SrfK
MFARICASVLIAALTSGVFMSAASANQLPLFLSPSAQTDAPLPLTPAGAATDGQGQETAGASARLQRQIVDYPTREAAGTIIIDTPNTYLYYVLGNGRALRYGIGVGREGFTWSGVETITRKAEWPDWTPPEEMIHRQPYLPRVMAGGPGNPLGARAMYLGGTIYRIHGTNDPQTIGQQVSSGCIRMVNEDVIDLYGRVTIGTKVIVRPAQRIEPAASRGAVRLNVY